MQFGPLTEAQVKEVQTIVAEYNLKGEILRAHGPSLHDKNTYNVIRRYDSLAQREHIEDSYYASDDWRQGPRQRIRALIESHTDIVLVVDDVTVQGLRK
jgi:hypothetical protein